jgi:hypothetical protein
VAARQVNLVLFARHPWTDVVDGYRRVADRAAALGLRVGLEFLPSSEVPTLDDVRPETGSAAPTVSELREEARHHPLPPGAGAGDLAGLLNALAASRFTAPVSVEVFSDRLDSRPALEVAHRLMAAARRTLSGAGWPSRRDLREGERGELDPPGEVQAVQR